MKKPTLITILSILTLGIVGCQNLQVVDTNPETGYFPTEKSATVVTNVKIDLDLRKNLVVVPSGGFTEGMTKNLGYFDRVITVEELEEIIVKEDLTDQVPSLQDRIGLSRAAKAYENFLWIHWDERKDGRNYYLQLKLVDPLTLDELFVAETYMDLMWMGVNDKMNRYPAFNAFIDYIKENSTSYN